MFAIIVARLVGGRVEWESASRIRDVESLTLAGGCECDLKQKPTPRGVGNAVCREDERKEVLLSLMRRAAVMNMTAEAQQDLLMSTADSLPVGHALKVRIVNVIERMTKSLAEIGEDLDPLDENLERDWIDALVQCRKRIQ
jgi:hypothetical protein